MSELKELYHNIILEHNINSKNYGLLEHATHQAEGDNPLCGDRVKITLIVDKGEVISTVGFEGVGCAISKASASMMTDIIKGKTKKQALELIKLFQQFVSTEKKVDLKELGILNVFAGVKEYPLRVKCASLAWHTLKSALEKGKSISTD